MKIITCALLICFAAARGFAQETQQERAVKVYYTGFEKHDWNMAASGFAKDFTFTSANNDNHIPLTKFKEKCWPTNRFFKKVNFVKMTESGNALFLLVEITTTDDKVVRNVDLFHFNAGKITAIETFFGRGESYPGNAKQ